MIKKLFASCIIVFACSFFCCFSSFAATATIDENYYDNRFVNQKGTTNAQSSIDVTVSGLEAGHRYWFYCNPDSSDFRIYCFDDVTDPSEGTRIYNGYQWSFAIISAQSKDNRVICAIDNKNIVYVTALENISSVVVTVTFDVNFTIMEGQGNVAINNAMYISCQYPYYVSSVGDDGIVDTQYSLIIDSILNSNKEYPDFLGENALVYFNDAYTPYVNPYGSGSVSWSNGYINCNNCTGLWLEQSDQKSAYFFAPGRYYCVASVSPDITSFGFFINNAKKGDDADYNTISARSFSSSTRGYLVVEFEATQ